MKLDKIRNRIDAIDHEILRALHSRMEMSLRTKKFKESVRDEDREKKIFERLKKYTGASRLLRGDFVETLFGSILSESRKIQEGNRTLIGFQGEHGAFGEAAALCYDPQFTPLPCPEFTDVFDGVRKGSLDLGIVPVENSLGGAITEVNEQLIKSDLKIVGAVKLRISHCLLQHPEADYREIRMAYSHPQALSQCRHFLMRHKLEPRPYYDTAGAARMVAEDRPKMAAAVAGRICADIYNLEIVKENIQDHADNFTRFLILAKAERLNGVDKCSIIFSTRHEAGALNAVLNIFSEEQINLTRIESMPWADDPGHYVFFLDFQSPEILSRVETILEKVRGKTNMLKYMGCYKEETCE